VTGTEAITPRPTRRVEGVVGRDHRAGDRRGAGAAVGLDHVAVQVQGALAEGFQVEGGAQRAADQALDFLGAAGLLAARGFAVHARVRRARQHAVFGRHPALPFALQEARHLVFDAGGADHLGVAAFDQHRTLGVLGVLAGDADGAQLVDGAVARAGGEGHGFLVI
jgi:hypothetical protein